MSIEQHTERASDILAVARGHIATGWCQGALERDGAVCALGALHMASYGDPYEVVSHENPGYLTAHSTAYMTLTKLAREFGYLSVSVYNNAPETTHQDVINWFDKAIAQAQEMGA